MANRQRKSEWQQMMMAAAVAGARAQGFAKTTSAVAEVKRRLRGAKERTIWKAYAKYKKAMPHR